MTRLRSFACTRTAAAGSRSASRAWAASGPLLSYTSCQYARRSTVGGGGYRETRDRCAEVEACPADDEGRAGRRENLVDRRVRPLLILPDRDAPVERDASDEPCRVGGRCGEHRQALV